MPVVVQRQVPGQWIRLSVSSRSSCVSPPEAFGRILDSCSRCSHLETWLHYFVGGLVPGRHASVSGCCLEEYSTLDPLGDVFSRAQCLARQWIQVMQSGYYREEDDFSYVRNAWLHSGYMLCYGTPGFWTNFEVFPFDMDSDPEAFLSVLHPKWRSVLSRCLRLWPMHALTALRNLEFLRALSGRHSA